jgi:ketosteroid isomerase-like protein
MTMTTREAFQKGTDAFNAHDIDAFAEVLADDVVFQAPGGMRGEGKAACVEFYGSWFGAFPDTLEVDPDADDLSRVLAEAVMRRQAGKR